MPIDKKQLEQASSSNQNQLRVKFSRRIRVLQVLALVLIGMALIIGIINLVRGLYWQAALDLATLILVMIVLIPLHRLRTTLNTTDAGKK